MASQNFLRAGAPAWPRFPAEPEIEGARDEGVGAADAASLIARLGLVLADIAQAVDELGEALASTLVAAAERDPTVLMRAQALDAVSQSLHGLTAFLAEVGRRQVGREPLHLDMLAAALPLEALVDRLSGVTTGTGEEDAVFF